MKCIILCSLLSLAWMNSAVAGRNPMENPGMYDGDMLGVELDENRNAISRDSLRWPNATMPYVMDKSLPRSHVEELYKAMRHIEKVSCFRFVGRTTERDYVKMYYGDGCFSNWGRVGAEQVLSMGESCDYFGVAVHELLHAVGFEHEHNRSDRDNHLIIYWENIEEKWYSAFRKLKPNDNRLLTPFDYDSIMLYGSKAFVKDYSLNSMVTKDGKILSDPHYKKEMTQSDSKRIRMLYECKK